MAIKSVELKNFTVFEDFKCEFSPRIFLLTSYKILTPYGTEIWLA